MNKFLAAAALTALAAAELQAAPTLGVEWRAAANPKTPGVKILSVADGSNAEELGLEKGDVVLAVNGQVVTTGKEATAAVVKAKGKLTLLVQSGRAVVQITAEIDEPTNGFAAGTPAKGGYKNVTRKKK